MEIIFKTADNEGIMDWVGKVINNSIQWRKSYPE